MGNLCPLPLPASDAKKARKRIHTDLQLRNITLCRGGFGLLAIFRNELQAARGAEVTHDSIHVPFEHQQLDLLHALHEKHQSAPSIESTSCSDIESCSASTAILSIAVSSSLSLKYATIGVSVKGSS